MIGSVLGSGCGESYGQGESQSQGSFSFIELKQAQRPHLPTTPPYGLTAVTLDVSYKVIWQMACERDDSSLLSVAWVVRFLLPASITACGRG